jgi:2-methylfumaryl-CoA hydratase
VTFSRARPETHKGIGVDAVDIGALRLRTVAAKDHACGDFSGHDRSVPLDPCVVLDIDWSVLMPRRT